MNYISVIIGTFGDEQHWGELANRAAKSAFAQTVKPFEVIHYHRDSLAEARNDGARDATGDWLLFLDADDELDGKFIEAMTHRANGLPDGDRWLLQPATLGVVDGREDPFPVVIERKPILDGNYLVISTLVKRSLFLEAGGFEDWPLYEDWDLWLRCWSLGAQSVEVPDAIYRINVNPNGRNLPPRDKQIAYYNAIRTRALQRPMGRY